MEGQYDQQWDDGEDEWDENPQDEGGGEGVDGPHVHVRTHAHVHIHVHVHSTCTCTYMYIHVHTRLHLHVHTHVHVHVHNESFRNLLRNWQPPGLVPRPLARAVSALPPHADTFVWPHKHFSRWKD